MTASTRARTTSNRVATSIGCKPLRDAYEVAVGRKPKAWGEVEDLFLRAMEGFDANIVSGIGDMGDLQNGKGDFFNDLLGLLLENCAGVGLYSRGGVPGLIFPKHHLDLTYPNTGVVQFMVEAKAVGTPKHAGSPRQKAIGRPGSADLDKRVKEIGFKAIDLKAEYARQLTSKGESPSVLSGDLTAWLRSVKPYSYVFIAARATDANDHERIVRYAQIAEQVSDGVGVFCFMPVEVDQPTRYRAAAVPSTVELSRVLFRACQQLRAIRDTQPVEAPVPNLALLPGEVPPPVGGETE